MNVNPLIFRQFNNTGKTIECQLKGRWVDPRGGMGATDVRKVSSFTEN